MSASPDAADLASLQVSRTAGSPPGGSFSAFAGGFSYFNPDRHLQMFHVGFGAVGPVSFWTWPAVFAGQLCVALCLAELAAQYPLAGGLYQWARLSSGESLGRIVGDFIGLPGGDAGRGATGLADDAAAAVVGVSAALVPLKTRGPQRRTRCCCALIGLSFVVNAVGVRLLAWINNAGVFAELLGALALVGLWVSGRRTVQRFCCSASVTVWRWPRVRFSGFPAGHADVFLCHVWV